MKVDVRDVLTYELWASENWQEIPRFDADTELKLQGELRKMRQEVRERPLKHTLMELLPYICLAMIWSATLLILPHLLPSTLWALALISVLHGIWGYSYVVFTLHEGAGHGLLKNSVLRTLAFQSCRLMFADPHWYREVHATHHRYLGTYQDGAFTHFVPLHRVWKSLLPGAGVLFPTDYKIHQGHKATGSLGLSLFVGGSFLALELYLLSHHFIWWHALVGLAVLGPWIGFGLDRLRESLEHWGMPADRQYGSREFGLGFFGLLIGGGPWGQPCHFSHHYAPDLSWYQQLTLHRKLTELASEEQKKLGINAPLKLTDITTRLLSSRLPGDHHVVH